jgi:hypothetical protein
MTGVRDARERRCLSGFGTSGTLGSPDQYDDSRADAGISTLLLTPCSLNIGIIYRIKLCLTLGFCKISSAPWTKRYQPSIARSLQHGCQRRTPLLTWVGFLYCPRVDRRVLPTSQGILAMILHERTRKRSNCPSNMFGTATLFELWFR